MLGSHHNRNTDKVEFKKWLEILQQESWQLELIISGFAIFLLVQTGQPLQDAIDYLEIRFDESRSISLVVILLNFIMIGRGFLIINLIFHVVFRGLWIATIGLRYVSGEIDIDALKFGAIFDKHLKRKLPDFDDYIETLEKICSILFAFTFVIVFCVISVGMFIVVTLAGLLGVAFVATKATNLTFINIFNVFVGLAFFGYMLALLVYFVDFVTFGRIKKWNWIAPIYLPIYRLFNYISLAFLYRPLMYNMIDNKFGRKMSRLFAPYIGIGFIFASLTSDIEFYKPDNYRGALELQANYYEAMVENTRDLQRSNVLLPNMYIDKPYLNIFIKTNPEQDMKTVEVLCPDFEKYANGRFKSKIFGSVNFSFQSKDKQANDLGMKCWAQQYFIRIDNVAVDTLIDWHFHTNPKTDMPGFLGILDIGNLEQGKHILNVSKQRIDINPFAQRRQAMDTVRYATIPFWYVSEN